MRVAVIDIGTVTCRLLVADVGPDGRLEELVRRAAIVNLGQGVDATGVLDASAMDRTVAQVAEYVQVIDELRAEGAPVRMRCLATSASRDAENAEEFAARLAELGVRLEVIPGEQEAAFAFAGAGSAFPGERLLVADVGGGSTELIAGTGGQTPFLARSFDIGSRRATERLLAADPPTADQLEAVRTWADELIAPFFAQLAEASFAPQRLVAVAGTATSAVSVHEAMAEYDPARVHGYHVTSRALDGVCARLAALSLAQRQEVVGLQPQRAAVIVAGLAILQAVVAAARTDGFTASEGDILQGAALALSA